MSVFIGILYVLEVFVCLLLALVVMMQKPKEGGLGGAFGGGMLEASLGADAGNVLIKVTAILGAIFLANTLLLARLTSVSHNLKGSVMAEAAEPAAQVQQAPAMPAAAPELPPEAPAAPALPAAPAVPALPAAAPAAPAAPAVPAAPAAPAVPAVPAAPAAPAQK